jgi:hypothetical protein
LHSLFPDWCSRSETGPKMCVCVPWNDVWCHVSLSVCLWPSIGVLLIASDTDGGHSYALAVTPFRQKSVWYPPPRQHIYSAVFGQTVKHHKAWR